MAAGLGTRLKTSIPKPLTPIFNEKTILDFQIEYLNEKIGKENIIVVVGFKNEKIIKRYPSLFYVQNDFYFKTNTAKSVLLALKHIHDDDVICLAGDVFFDEGVLDPILKSKYSSCLVDRKECGKEEVKYLLGKDGFIKQISKSTSNHNGEALGIFLIKKNDLRNVINELELLCDNDYFSTGLQNLIFKENLKMKPVNVNGHFCHEIDLKSDLEYVKAFIKERESKSRNLEKIIFAK